MIEKRRTSASLRVGKGNALPYPEPGVARMRYPRADQQTTNAEGVAYHPRHPIPLFPLTTLTRQRQTISTFQNADTLLPFRMPQSLSRVYLHIIFSTKNREPLISPETLPELHRYLGGVANQHECPALTVGGVTDHVHILSELSRTKTIGDLLADLKRSSSLWMKQRFPAAA